MQRRIQIYWQLLFGYFLANLNDSTSHGSHMFSIYEEAYLAFFSSVVVYTRAPNRGWPRNSCRLMFKVQNLFTFHCPLLKGMKLNL